MLKNMLPPDYIRFFVIIIIESDKKPTRFFLPIRLLLLHCYSLEKYYSSKFSTFFIFSLCNVSVLAYFSKCTFNE